MENVDGKIAAILSKTSVVINRGSLNGVEENDTFVIYTKLGPFYDPDTNANLGTTTKVWGSVEVKIVEDRFCVAETGYIYKNNLFDFANLFGRHERVELPVKTEQILRGGIARIEVGFSVKLVKQEKIIQEKKVEALPPKTSEAESSPEEIDSISNLTENSDAIVVETEDNS